MFEMMGKSDGTLMTWKWPRWKKSTRKEQWKSRTYGLWVWDGLGMSMTCPIICQMRRHWSARRRQRRKEEAVGLTPDIPLSDVYLEPEAMPPMETLDPYVAEMPFPHAPPGPAENEVLDGRAPDLLPRSQDVDLVVSAVNLPLPAHLRNALRCWTREDLNVRVLQGVRSGGQPAHQVCCR